MSFRPILGLLSAAILIIFGLQARSQSVRLDWFVNPEPDIAAYKVYYGGQSGIYTNFVNAGKATNVTVVGLTAGTRYFFVATAYNSVGSESEPSDEISYDVPAGASTVTAPLASTTPASVAGPNGAVLNGSVDPNGATTYGWFEYGLSTSYGLATTPVNMGSSSTASPLSSSISGLQAATTYHFRCVATNSLGISRGVDYSFTTPGLAPSATTQPAGNLTATSATVNGSVNPNGTATGAWFEYGLTSSYGSVTSTTNAGSGAVAVSVSSAISGLSAGTTYHFRIASSNSAGVTRGVDMSFTTATIANLATVTTLPATVTGNSTATLNGSVNPNATPTVAWFEYGLTTSYGSQTASSSVGSGSAAVSLNSPLSGLTPGATYHFRIVSSNSAGISRGADLSFTTPPIANLATVITLAATTIGSSNVTLNGSVNPNATPTVAWFEYGLDATYGDETAVTDAGSGTVAVSVSTMEVGLAPATTYHFRIVSSNSAGFSRGVDLTFTTQPVSKLGSVTTLAATVTDTAAMLNGAVNPNATPTVAWFEYGLDTTYGFQTTASDVGSGTVAVNLSRFVSGLTQNTTYHFRIVSSNSAGISRGADLSFTTQPSTLASVSTLAGVAVSSTTAKLNGAVDPNGTPTTAWFEFGPDANYGYTSPVLDAGNGLEPVGLVVQVTNLPPGQTWHFRIVAQNGAGTSVGDDGTFTLFSSAPNVSTLPVLSVSPHDSMLYGSVTPGDYAATVYFQYGTSTNLGNTTPVVRLDPGYSLKYVTRKAPGLKPEITYYYRIVAATSAGTVVGEIQSFTTLPR